MQISKKRNKSIILFCLLFLTGSAAIASSFVTEYENVSLNNIDLEDSWIYQQ